MNYKRTCALLLALAAAVGLVACGGSVQLEHAAVRERRSRKEKPLTIVVRNEEPVDGVETLEYSAGEQVEFKVDVEHARPRSMSTATKSKRRFRRMGRPPSPSRPNSKASTTSRCTRLRIR